MLLRLATLFLLAVTLGVNAAGPGWEYTDCGSSSHPLQIESIELSPDPPVPGQDLTVTVHGMATDTIQNGATADVTVKLGLVKLLQKKFDVCEEARKADMAISCPVQPGVYSIVQTVRLPNEIPRAKFNIQVRGSTVENQGMMCLDLKLDFMGSMSAIFNSPF